MEILSLHIVTKACRQTRNDSALIFHILNLPVDSKKNLNSARFKILTNPILSRVTIILYSIYVAHLRFTYLMKQFVNDLEKNCPCY
ncbi:hypothetical protein C0J52_23667 [Blattella germanica]|nr:hypothetical protein C0J52_23667 [Blattella germanica]